MRTVAVLALLIPLSLQAAAQTSRPRPPLIIDMHLHALGAEWAGGKLPAPVCVPVAASGETCPRTVWSPPTEEAIMRETLAVMERRNIIGVLSGQTPEYVRRWSSTAPDRFIPGLRFDPVRFSAITPEAVRRMIETGSVKVFGEVLTQYVGIAPNDERMEPYWALAEELNIPVAIHMGEGYPGAPHLGSPGYRVRLGSPLLMEEVLVRHPKLRVYVMHYGSPLVNEMVALLFTYPQVYVDLGGLQWTYPREYFHAQLKQLVDAGFGHRIMFGSDQMVWPEVIDGAIAAVEEAPFLTPEQKRDIFCRNAARFLRLDVKRCD